MPILRLQRDAGNAAVNGLLQQGKNLTGIDLTGAYRGARRDLLMALSGLASQAKQQALDQHDIDDALPLFNVEWDLGTLETNLEADDANADAEEAKQETLRLIEQIEVMEAQADHKQGHPGNRAAERLRVLSELTIGTRDGGALTDAVFFMRHPERESRHLDPSDPADAGLIEEWNAIRTRLVPSVLASKMGRLLSSMGG